MSLFEVSAMRRAVALSALGLGTTSPNPPVGCVVLDVAGEIVGEGYHERKGEAHAEVNALAAAGTRAVGGTALVTLEPCNHHGRTPPCHQALLDAGVVRVVIAVLDPTSRGEGGAARLSAAGVPVEVGVLAEEALLVLGPWLAALEERRPRVTWVYSFGSDGVTAASDVLVGEAGLRWGFDAVLREDGSVEEGMRGGHGEGAFSLMSNDLEPGPLAVLSSLYVAGTRSVLLHGGLRLAEPFLQAGLVDRINLFVSSAPSMGPGEVAPQRWPQLPPGFRLESVRRLTGGVVIDAAP